MDIKKILQKLRLSSTTPNNQAQPRQHKTSNDAMANKAITFYSHRMWLLSSRHPENIYIFKSTNSM